MKSVLLLMAALVIGSTGYSKELCDKNEGLLNLSTYRCQSYSNKHHKVEVKGVVFNCADPMDMFTPVTPLRLKGGGSFEVKLSFYSPKAIFHEKIYLKGVALLYGGQAYTHRLSSSKDPVELILEQENKTGKVSLYGEEYDIECSEASNWGID